MKVQLFIIGGYTSMTHFCIVCFCAERSFVFPTTHRCVFQVRSVKRWDVFVLEQERALGESAPLHQQKLGERWRQSQLNPTRGRSISKLRRFVCLLIRVMPFFNSATSKKVQKSSAYSSRSRPIKWLLFHFHRRNKPKLEENRRLWLPLRTNEFYSTQRDPISHDEKIHWSAHMSFCTRPSSSNQFVSVFNSQMIRNMKLRWMTHNCKTWRCVITDLSRGWCCMMVQVLSSVCCWWNC